MIFKAAKTRGIINSVRAYYITNFNSNSTQKKGEKQGRRDRENNNVNNMPAIATKLIDLLTMMFLSNNICNYLTISICSKTKELVSHLY